MQEGVRWGGFQGGGGTPCVFAERRNINNTGKAKRNGLSNKNEVTIFSGSVSYISHSRSFQVLLNYLVFHTLQ